MISDVKYSQMNPLLRWMTEDRVWIVEEEITLTFVMDDEEYEIVLPIGFDSDLASIPRFARSIVPQVGRQNLPAIFHDYTYREEMMRWLGKENSDELFRQGMVVCKVIWIRRKVLYHSVDVFGGSSYQP